jgi:hypothetical protein
VKLIREGKRLRSFRKIRDEEAGTDNKNHFLHKRLIFLSVKLCLQNKAVIHLCQNLFDEKV